MKKHYLMFVSLAYSYPILRPIQQEIWRRGDDVAWFVEPNCPVLLEEKEKLLPAIDDVIAYNPVAIFAPGNYIYDFFPGIKVSVFHGYPINKRGDKRDDHFAIRGWFDMYCTQGESSTVPFLQQERKYGYFKVYETGWCKADSFFNTPEYTAKKERPVILYSTTFTPKITSAPTLLPTIKRLASEKKWDWIISFHPMYADKNIINEYKKIAENYDNVTFNPNGQISAKLLQQTDVLLSDASSIIMESMLCGKPVVTFRNTMPGNHLINVTHERDVAQAIEQALTRPAELIKNIREYMDKHEAHFNGKSSAAVLDAVDNFIQNYQGKLKNKPYNLLGKIKLRRRIGYPIFRNLLNK